MVEQQFGKMGVCLHTTTSNDYVWTFKQTTLWYHFKKGGPLGHGHDRNELFLDKTTQFGDLKQLVNAILKYAPSSSFTTTITHMERDEIFGFCKWKLDLLPRSKGDSHKHDCVEFSHPRVHT